jgi:hypothetical protein
MRLAMEATDRKNKYYVLDAHVADFNFPTSRAYSMTIQLLNQVRDGSEEEVPIEDVLGLTEWTSHSERRKGELRLPPTPGPIVRPLERPAPFRPKGDTSTTYILPPLIMAKMLLAKHKGEHHELGLLGLLTVMPAIHLPAPEQERLDTLSNLLFERSRPGMTCRNGVYTPNFRLWSNGCHFAGQNVSAGNAAPSRVKSVESLGMEQVDIPEVRNSAAVFEEYVRHCKSFGSITMASKSAGTENKRVYFHTPDTATPDELTESIEGEGDLAYDAQVKFALESMHRVTLRCKGDQSDMDRLAERKRKTSTKPAPKRRRRVKSAPIVSSSSSSSSSDDEPSSPRPSTCE